MSKERWEKRIIQNLAFLMFFTTLAAWWLGSVAAILFGFANIFWNLSTFHFGYFILFGVISLIFCLWTVVEIEVSLSTPTVASNTNPEEQEGQDDG